MKLSSALLLYILLGMSLPVAAAQDMIKWTGGITIDERQAAPRDGTKLSFFITSGPYLSAIEVTIWNSAGRQILSTTTDGPWLLVDLPAGEYSVRGRRQNGSEQSLKIQVAQNRNETFGFGFPGE